VTVDRPVTVGHIVFSGAHSYTIAAAEDTASSITLDVKSGDALILVHQGSHVISAPVTLADDAVITVFDPRGKLTIAGPLGNGTGNLTKGGAGSVEVASVRAPSLSLNGGTTSLVARGAPGPAPATTSVLGELSIAGNPSSPLATLDLSTSAVVIDFSAAGENPAASIRQLILSGRGGSGLNIRWNGTGITSSQVQADVAAKPNITSVAYADNATLPLGPYATFRGEPVDKTAVLIGYTRTGDANLDGVVNDDDVTIVGAAYAPGKPQPSWALGDFDYNGFVDDDDVTLLGAFYGPSAPPIPAPAAAAGTIAAVPEPETITLFLATIAACAIAAVRRRR
jgi:hypothetical protein